jgi:heme-degrading monooxygenase HmoA
MVPCSLLEMYLDHVHTNMMPAYKAAPGLVSVSVFQRSVVGYVEFLTLTMWRSEQALTIFLAETLATKGESDYGVIQMEPHVYQLVFRE